ncbi:MAG: GNAT family N-acetyltransferase [Salaquimonas sp.]
MTVSITAETPLQDDVRKMIAELNDVMRPLTPPEFQFQMTAEQIAESATTLFIARDETDAAVGMGALKVHNAEMGEVKRMYTRDSARGKGVGYQLLNAVEALAAEKSLQTLMLETGNVPTFDAAFRIYERNGFTVRGPFLDYPDSGWSRFYEKKIRS